MVLVARMQTEQEMCKTALLPVEWLVEWLEVPASSGLPAKVYATWALQDTRSTVLMNLLESARFSPTLRRHGQLNRLPAQHGGA